MATAPVYACRTSRKPITRSRRTKYLDIAKSALVKNYRRRVKKLFQGYDSGEDRVGDGISGKGDDEA
jgi:hypothetical protein